MHVLACMCIVLYIFILTLIKIILLVTYKNYIINSFTVIRVFCYIGYNELQTILENIASAIINQTHRKLFKVG